MDKDGIIIVNAKKGKNNHYEALAFRECGYLHEYTYVGCSIDKGHLNGEYGSKPSKQEIDQLIDWCLHYAALETPNKLWRVY